MRELTTFYQFDILLFI